MEDTTAHRTTSTMRAGHGVGVCGRLCPPSRAFRSRDVPRADGPAVLPPHHPLSSKARSDRLQDRAAVGLWCTTSTGTRRTWRHSSERIGSTASSKSTPAGGRMTCGALKRRSPVDSGELLRCEPPTYPRPVPGPSRRSGRPSGVVTQEAPSREWQKPGLEPDCGPPSISRLPSP